MAQTQIFYIVFGYIVAYLYALKFAVVVGKEENRTQFPRLNELHEGCMLGCTTAHESQKKWWQKLTQYRGKNYYIGIDKSANSCFATFWSFSHIFLYVFLGYMAPKYFWTTFFIGAIFEWYEYAVYDCHDPLDVAFNTLGFLTGRYMRCG